MQRFAHAFTKGFGPFFRKHPVGSVIFVLYCGGIIFMLGRGYYDVYLAPPEEQRARAVQEARSAANVLEAKQRRAEANAQRAVEDERLKALCQVKAQCQTWAKARQACAVAGNFETCMSIKMEHADEVAWKCNADGHMGNRAEEPSALECLLH